MSMVELKGGTLRGTVAIPPSKSMSHRAIIAAALSRGTSKVRNVVISKDIKATCEGVEALGAKVRPIERPDGRFDLSIEGAKSLGMAHGVIPCDESGSTLRFLMPLAAIGEGVIRFVGSKRLSERPLLVYHRLFNQMGTAYETEEGGLPLSVYGVLRPGDYTLSGDVSSQFVSGLLFALPLLEADSLIRINGDLESVDYVSMTIEVLKTFGVEIRIHEKGVYYIPGGQVYRPTDYEVEGDYSQAAFWLVAGCLNGPIACRGLKPHSSQGDKAIIDVLRSMGANIVEKAFEVIAYPSKLKGLTIDARNIPDLVPVLSVAASLAEGTTNIRGTKRLKLKESDRALATASELGKLGVRIQVDENEMTIIGRQHLNPGILWGWNDHRIVMAMAVAASTIKEPIQLEGYEAVSKSYPNFWRDYLTLGGLYEHRFSR